MQVPQELASLTTLTMLSLARNQGTRDAGRALGWYSGDGLLVMPKMWVTEEACRYLLHFPVLSALYLTVFQGEAPVPGGLFAHLQKGPCIVHLDYWPD